MDEAWRMKAYERRAAGQPDFNRLSVWDARNGCWKASKRFYETEAEARAAATKSARYRITKFDGSGNSSESEAFEVGA
jgi:hypothetical protein